MNREAIKKEIDMLINDIDRQTFYTIDTTEEKKKFWQSIIDSKQKRLNELLKLKGEIK